MIPVLNSLNQILSSDFLINSRYDIVTNFNQLNTYCTQTSAGLAQIAPEADMIGGLSIGMVTPYLLAENELEFTLRENLDLLIEPDGGAPYSWNAVSTSSPTSSWLVNIKYLGDNFNYFNNTVLDETYLRRNGDDTPSVDDTWDLGTASLKWANIYATNFNGTATRALYADVAEIYTCGEKLEVGTLVSVATEGEYEVEASTGEKDINCIGIVSENPGYLLNSGGKGVTVGLVGKVPVRVQGEIKKGDVLVPSNTRGVAKAADKPDEYVYAIARATEAKSNTGFGYVTCIIKR
jgi:hypothetical protein